MAITVSGVGYVTSFSFWNSAQIEFWVGVFATMSVALIIYRGALPLISAAGVLLGMAVLLYFGWHSALIPFFECTITANLQDAAGHDRI